MEKPTRKEAKAQSAMEYLMTYGWALLAIAVVLAILYATGILGGGISRLIGSNTCIEATGYLCTNPSLSASTGQLSVAVGQESSGTYYNVAFTVATSGTTLNVYGVPSVTFNGLSVLNSTTGANNQLAPGEQVLLQNYQVTTANTAAGTSVTGELWMAYETSSGGAPCAAVPTTSCSYVQIGKLSMVAH